MQIVKSLENNIIFPWKGVAKREIIRADIWLGFIDGIMYDPLFDYLWLVFSTGSLVSLEG